MPDQSPPDRSPEDARITDLVIRIGLLGLLLYWSLTLIQPFLPVVIWAVVLAVALFPLQDWLGRKLGGRYGLSSVLVTLLMLGMVLGPVAALAASLVETVQFLLHGLTDGTLRIPKPPAGVADWPIIGAPLHEAWSLGSGNLESALRTYGPKLAPAAEPVLRMLSSIGIDLLRFVLAALVAGVLFRTGRPLAEGGRRLATRIIAPRGGQFVDMAGATIRNVSRGVVGVAVLQTVLAGIVLQLAGVPGAGLLAFAILILCIIQIGPVLVILPVLIWAWATKDTGSALLLTVLLVPIGLLDNVLKPILMSRGLSTPTLVIFLGVIGGTVTYGLIGLFLGPIVLSVFYDLMVSWARFDPASDRSADAAPGPGSQP
jgi:predicted PurR-regulated permease PerM